MQSARVVRQGNADDTEDRLVKTSQRSGGSSEVDVALTHRALCVPRRLNTTPSCAHRNGCSQYLSYNTQSHKTRPPELRPPEGVGGVQSQVTHFKPVSRHPGRWSLRPGTHWLWIEGSAAPGGLPTSAPQYLMRWKCLRSSIASILIILFRSQTPV